MRDAVKSGIGVCLGLALTLLPALVLAEHSAGMGSMKMGASAPSFDRNEARAVSGEVLGQSVAGVTLTDRTGQRVSLSMFEGRPLVISLIFTSCYHICPTTTQHLDKVVKKAREALGDDAFSVVTVGFDTLRDTPPMMDEFARRQGIDDPDWLFLSGDRKSIDELTASLGFLFEPAGGGFNHLIQTSVIDQEGRVYQQVFGMTYDAPYLIEPLKRLVFKTSAAAGLISNLSNQVRLFCTVYDPTTDRYKFDYSLYIGTFIGFMCVLVLGVTLVREWRRTLRSRGGV